MCSGHKVENQNQNLRYHQKYFPKQHNFGEAPTTCQFPLLLKHPSVLCVSGDWGKASHLLICTIPLLRVYPWVASY